MERIKRSPRMARGSELTKNKRLLLAEHKCCELCGRDYLPLNVHHKVPVLFGGSDSRANLIVVCERCHALLHAGMKAELIKQGMLSGDYSTRYVRLADFLSILWKEDYCVTPSQVIDLATYLSGIKTENNSWVAEFCEDTCDGPRSRFWYEFMSWLTLRRPDELTEKED